MYSLEQLAADRQQFQAAVEQGLAYRPLYVKLKLVWTCNLRCGMCNHWRSNLEKPLEIGRFKRIVDQLAELGCRKIHITGGEPTLYPDLVSLVDHISQQGIRVNMTTNATLIDKEMARALAAAGLRRVNVSIDSPDRRLHDKVRGVKGSWKRAVKGVGYLRRRLKKGKVCINTVVGRDNYRSLLSMPDLARQLGADYWKLIPLDEHTGDLRRLNKAQIGVYNRQVAPKIAEKGVAAGLFQEPAEAYPFGRDSQTINFSKQGLYAHGFYEQHPCFAPWTHMLIDHRGRVHVCCMLREKPVLGDLSRQDVDQVWQGAAYQELRRRPVRPLFSACHRCDDFTDENRQIVTLLDAAA